MTQGDPMSTKRFLPALLAALLLAAPPWQPNTLRVRSSHQNPKTPDQKQCLDMERDYWQKKLDTRYKAMQGICKKFSGPEAETQHSLLGSPGREPAQLAGVQGQHASCGRELSQQPKLRENLAWFEIDQLRKRIHDLETLDPSLARPPTRRSIPWMTSRRGCRISATAWNPCSIPA